MGADVGGDAFIVSAQSKQTQVQEWTQWKQWALDHKNFPAFKEAALLKIKKHNEKVAMQLQTKEVQDEIKTILRKDKERSKSNAIKGTLLVLLIFSPFAVQYIQRNFLTNWRVILDQAEKEFAYCKARNYDKIIMPAECRKIERSIEQIKGRIR